MLVWLLCRDDYDIIFSPVIFINELYKSIVGIIPLFFGFLLVDFYWSRRTSNILIRNFISQFVSSTEKIMNSSYLLGLKKDEKPGDGISYDSRRLRIQADLNSINEDCSSLATIIQSIRGFLEGEFLAVTTSCLETITKNLQSLSEFDLEHCENENDFFSYNEKLGVATKKLHDHFDAFVQTREK